MPLYLHSKNSVLKSCWFHVGHRIWGKTYERPSFVMTSTFCSSSLQIKKLATIIVGNWSRGMLESTFATFLSHFFTLLLTESIACDNWRGGELVLSWRDDDMSSEDRVMRDTDSSIRLRNRTYQTCMNVEQIIDCDADARHDYTVVFWIA